MPWKDEYLLAYRDWLVTEAPDSVYLSDHLSGVMALESAASLYHQMTVAKGEK
jgi:hypothetical protein